MKEKLPKGILIPIGGGEDKKHEKLVLCRIINETGKENPRICIITLATELPEEVAKDYKRAFKGLGIKNVCIVYFELRSEADSPDNLKKVKECDVILFSGGDQLRLTSLLGGTCMINTIKARYCNEAGFIVAGTSAGAAVMSDTMIISGSAQDALVKGELQLTNGLDFINNVFIDTHFTERGRFGRILQTVTYNPGVLGIGLGEDTAIVIKKSKLEVIGSGLVMIADGAGIVYTNLTEIENGDTITVEGIKIHILGNGRKFSIIEKQLIRDSK